MRNKERQRREKEVLWVGDDEAKENMLHPGQKSKDAHGEMKGLNDTCFSSPPLDQSHFFLKKMTQLQARTMWLPKIVTTSICSGGKGTSQFALELLLNQNKMLDTIPFKKLKMIHNRNK